MCGLQGRISNFWCRIQSELLARDTIKSEAGAAKRQLLIPNQSQRKLYIVDMQRECYTLRLGYYLRSLSSDDLLSNHRVLKTGYLYWSTNVVPSLTWKTLLLQWTPQCIYKLWEQQNFYGKASWYMMPFSPKYYEYLCQIWRNHTKTSCFQWNWNPNTQLPLADYFRNIFFVLFRWLFGQSRFCRLELVDYIANIVYFMTTVTLLLFMLCRKPCGCYRSVVGGDFPEKMPMCNVFSFTINRSKSCLRSS